MWNTYSVVFLVLFNKKYCHCQDLLQERTTLVESIEETSDSPNVLDGSSTPITDNPDNWHSFGKTVATFNNIFNDHYSSFEWKTDNLSIFGTSNTEDTIGWNIFEDLTTDTTERIKNANNLQNLVTAAIKNDHEHDVTDTKISNTETTEIVSKFTDPSYTTEFAGFFNELQESTTNVANSEDTTKAVDEELSLSALILKIMDALKNPDPVGIPGVDIPDPNPIPDMSQSITIFDKLYFTNSAVRGMSKLRILYINIDVESLEVQAAMHIDKLHTSGHYRYSSLMISRNGPYSVDIRSLLITARANLGVQRDGKLRAQDITMELNHENIDVNFGNIDPLLAGLINDAGDFIFHTVKPYMQQDAYTKVRTAIDAELQKTAEDLEFSNSLPPLDMILIDIGNKIRELSLDPYRIKDYVTNDAVSFVSVALYNSWITGVSTFHRVGNITMKVANGTAVLDFEVGTKTLEGRTHWNITVGTIISYHGKICFCIEQISLRVVISQPLDTRKTPKLKDLQIDIGNLQLRSDGVGTVDYFLEFTVNILPNLLRYQIVDALEWPLRNKVQEELDKINVEETIKQEWLPKINEIQKTGFKLSSLRAVREDSNDDEFFNF